MQIAIREDQPRFESAGGLRATKPASGHPFDELVRAMSARDNRPGADRAADERPIDERATLPERDRTHVDHDYSRDDSGDDDYRSAEEADGNVRERELLAAASDSVRPPDAPATGDASPDVAATEPATAAEARQPGASSAPGAVPAEAAAAAPVVPGEPAAAKAAGSGAQAAATPLAPDGARSVDDDVLAQLYALLQAGGPLIAMEAAGKGPVTASPQGPGLPVALLAQSLSGMPQLPGTQAPFAPGQRILAGNLAAKTAGKQVNAAPAKGGASGPADFNAIAAALSQGPAARGATPAASATSATPAVAIEGASTAPATPAGTPAFQALAERAGPAARADGPTQPHHTPRLNGPEFAERIGLTIARAAESGMERLSIRLNPRELGRIDVRMEMGQDGRMTLSVAAERQETLDQLQRNSRDLERALGDAGFDTSAGDLSFSLRREQSSGDQDGNGRDAGRRSGGEPGSEPDGANAADGMIIIHQTDSHMVVDLYV